MDPARGPESRPATHRDQDADHDSTPHRAQPGHDRDIDVGDHRVFAGVFGLGDDLSPQTGDETAAEVVSGRVPTSIPTLFTQQT